MKLLFGIFVLSLIGCSQAYFHCSGEDTADHNYPQQVCYTTQCSYQIKKHIKEELFASFTYMYLAARFDADDVHRPGMAKFLYESASEERSHAIQMLDYLNMRGITFDEDFSFDANSVLGLQEQIKNLTYYGALVTALDLEIDVTNKIYEIVSKCADDFHSADFFTDPILAEQHTGIRKLQGAIKSFTDLMHGHGPSSDQMALVEYIFDNKMLSGSV